jgi:hypothetical protein
MTVSAVTSGAESTHDAHCRFIHDSLRISITNTIVRPQLLFPEIVTKLSEIDVNVVIRKVTTLVLFEWTR